MSYLRLCHLTEYFGNTVVYLHPFKALGYIGDIEHEGYYDEESEEEINRFTINGVRVSTNPTGHASFTYEVDLDEEGYDQLVPSVIQPYFPRTQYVDVKGAPCLLLLNNPQHYKRSADGERYSMSCPYSGDRVTRITQPWTWSTVDAPSMSDVGRQLDEYNAGVLSSDLCIKKVRDRMSLDWLGRSIGKVNDNLGVQMHPLYLPHFEGLLNKTGAILC